MTATRKRRKRGFNGNPDCPGYSLPEGHPARPDVEHLTEASRALSEPLGAGMARLEQARSLGDYGPPEGRTKQPAPEWVQRVLDYLAGPARAAEREAAPDSYREEVRTCPDCRQQALVICQTRGGVYKELPLCECALPEALRVRGREIREAAEAQRQREAERELADLRAGRYKRRMLELAQDCAADHLRRHNKCTDNLQNYEECAVCKLRTVKAQRNRERISKNG